MTEISEGVFSECTQLKKVHLSDAITELPEEAFADCPTLQEINIPKSCKIIGNKAFYGTALSAIDIPGSVKEIGEYAFAECRNLTKITLHEGIEIIRSRCFSGCPAENVRIPKSVKKLSGTAFIDVTDRKIGNNIEWEINNGVLTLSGTGATYSFTEMRDSPISDRQEKIKSVIIGEGITEIGDYTISLFYDDEVKEITLPDSLKRIGKKNFSRNEIEQLTLPPHLEYIGDEAFSSSAKITELVIPESVKEIGNDAFLGATSLQKLTLPETAIKLGCGIFQNCRSLETVHLPDTMTEIPDEVFYGCEALRECNFPANCTQIGSLAFADTDISEIDIPSHVKVLKSGAFSECSDLNEITLHEGLESLGNKCFYGCPAKEIRVPDSVKYIGSECFSEMIQTLKLPDNKELQVEEDALPKNWLKKQTGFLILGDGILYQYREETGPDNGWIGNDITWEINDGVLTLSGTGATYSYSNTEKPPFAAYGNFITEISIGEGITELGAFLFYENIPLVTSVTFPDSLRRIGESAFSHNIFLGSVTFPPHLESIGTNAFDHIAITEIDIPDSVKEIGRSVFSYCDQLKTVRLPDTLTKIPEEIFLGCNVLEEITIPPSCTIIGADAFNQSGITAIDIPESVKKIGQRAFFYCYDLAQVTLHEGLETLGAYCFDNCYALSEIILPQSVKSIGKECFSSLTTVTKAVAPSQPRPKPAAEAESGKIGDNITWEFKDATLTLSGTGKTYSYRNYKDSPLCEISQKSSKIVIGEGITEIGNHVFTLPGESETEIVFPDSLLRIGDWNFSGYSAKQLTLPPNLEYIGEYAFYGMQNVTELVIPESVREIGADAFSNAWVLQKAALPDTDIIIREGVFSICGQLKTVQLPSGMTEIPNALFSGCTMLEKLKIPDQITKIGYSAFSGCKFRQIVLPDTVKTICGNAFAGCENLTGITLPDGLETIGEEAFFDCPLEELRIPESVTSIGAGLCDTFYHDETAVQQTPDLTLPTHKNLQIAEGALPQRWLEKQKGFLTLGDGILYHYSTDETEDTLIVPDGVKTIYPDAFRSIRAKSLILPESLQEIRSGAFRECVFESVTFLAQDVSIADDACKSTSIKLIRSNYYSTAQIFAMDSGIPFTALTPDQPVALEPPDPETDLLPFGNNGGVFGESYTLTEKSKMCLRNYTPLSLRSDLEESLAENWKGSCYGLSAVTVLVQAGLLKPSALDPEAKTLHDIRPELQAVDFINYYQMSYKQMLNIYLSNYPNENSQYQKLCHAIREAQDYNNGGNPFILTLLTGSDGSHAVVGYGLEAGSWTWNDQVYNRRIRIWDSNYFGLDDRCCIYFDLDTLNFTLPAYNIRYNMNKDSDLGRILLICDNPAEINMNPHPSQLVQGDLNRDKASTVADAVLFARYLAEDAALPASVCADAFLADSNGDDILDYTDLVAMLSGKGKQDN